LPAQPRTQPALDRLTPVIWVVGVWRETRILGELSPLVAMTFAIQVEKLLRLRARTAVAD